MKSIMLLPVVLGIGLTVVMIGTYQPQTSQVNITWDDIEKGKINDKTEFVSCPTENNPNKLCVKWDISSIPSDATITGSSSSQNVENGM